MRLKLRPLIAAATLAVAIMAPPGAVGQTDTEQEILSVLKSRTSTDTRSFRNLSPGEPQTAEPTDPADFEVVEGFKMGNLSTRAKAAAHKQARKQARAAALPVNNEKFISADRVFGQPDINTYTITFSVTGTTTKTYKVKGVYGQSSATLIVTFGEDGSAQIAAQKYITNNPTYGNIWFCPVDLTNNTYSLTDPVVCTRDEEGNWSMGAWALVVNHTTDKGYNGKVLFVSEKSDWLVPNMTATFTTTDASGADKENTFEGAWLQDDNSCLYLLNMGNTVYGRAINVRLTPQHTGILSPQFVSDAGGYGNLYAYYADYATGQAASSRSASCSVTDDNKLVFNDLIIATRSITNANNIRIAASPITYTLKGADILFPDPISINFEGKGTQANPYLIKSVTDLVAMASALSEPGYATACYKLMNDIDLSGMKQFTPIGDDQVPFNGTFDGNSKKLSGLTYNGFGFTYTGLFGVLGSKAVVKDLTLDNFTIYATGPNAGILTAYNASGSVNNVKINGSLLQTKAEVAGAIAGMNTGKITGCVVNATINGYGANGGIVGYNCGEIGFCDYSGQMSMSGALNTSYRHVAGIAAQSLSSASSGLKGYIHDCTVSGTITEATGYVYVGGIVAVSHGAKTEDPSVIERCINTATLSATGLDWTSDPTLPKSYCGGIVGYISSTTLTDCANGGLILETSLPKVFTGGVVGIASVSFISSGSDHRLGQMSSVKRCLSVGQIYSPSGAGCGIYGAVPVLDAYDSDEVAAQIFSDCHADSQINLLTSDLYAMSTSELTSGTLPAGLSANIWTAAAARYPVPTSLKSNDAALLLAAPAVLAAGETYNNVKKNITLDGAITVKWGILGANGSVVQSSPSLTISGTTAAIGTQYGSNWLVATQGNIVKMLMVSIVPKLFDGAGTADDPFLIKSIADMATLNSAVTTYGQPHLGDYFKMTADIDASADPTFVCVGYPTMTRPFEGTFDGDGHSFHNLAVKTAFRTTSGGVTANKSYQYGGLFSCLGTSGTIKNVNIAADCVYDVYNMSGSIAGISYGRIENCRNYAAIGANGMATGGIVGENNGTVTGCYNAGNITVQQKAIKTGAGGIAGASTGLIDLCQNDGDVKIADGMTSEVFGGIAAINYGKIDRSINLGEVKANVKAGGITATLGAYGTTGEITRSANFGTVTTVKDKTNGAVTNEVRDNKITDVVYDSSLTYVGASINPLTGCTALTTHELVSGEAPAGLPADMLDLRAGMYPVLKSFAAETRTALLRSTYIDFSNSQSVANLGSDVALSSAENVTWNLSGSSSFSIDGNTLKVTVPQGELSEKTTATASAGDVVVKTFNLTSLPILFDGNGTAESPYLIKNKEDLNTLSSFISNNAYDCLNMYYQLVNDIAYEDTDTFTPVGGDGTTMFNGSFDGNGKTISGIVYTSTTAKPGKNTGLFGQVGAQGVIHDLTVNNTLTGYGAGGVVAQLSGRAYNCVNRGSVTATGDPAGGIVGTLKAGGNVANCSNFGTVLSEKAYGTGGIAGKCEAGSAVADCQNEGTLGGEKQGKILGGIAGMAAGNFSGCHNKGQLISATASVGGIVGKHLSGALLEISNCTNTAAINNPKAIAVGGIIGGNDSDKSNNKAQVHIDDCQNSGTVAGVLGVGGVVGIVSESDFTLTNSSNSAAVEAYNLGAKGYADTFVGGLAGCANGSAVEGTDMYIKNCYNTGTVTAWGGNNIGGLVGKNGAPVISCYNTGNVKAVFGGDNTMDLTTFSMSSIGGISGSAYGAVSDTWNSGNVETDGCWIGGIAGYTNKDITGCANIGEVKGVAGLIPGGSDTQGVGGIVGRMGSVSYAGFISDCYNTGNVTGLTQVAGIVAQRFGNEAQLANVYNTGTVTATAEGGTAFAIGNQRTDGAETLPADAHVYYLDGCCTAASALDKAAKAMSRDELSGAELGDAFINSHGALPVLSALVNPTLTYFGAVYGIVFENESDSAAGATGNIFYAALPGLVWTSSQNISLADGVASPNDNGKGWLKVEMPDDSDMFKQFDVTITGLSGINGITGDDAVSVEYYNLQGIRIASPEPGTVCVERALLPDGKVRVSRIVAK